MADLIIQPKNDDHLKLNNDAGTTILELANDESKLRLAQNNISASDGTTAITTSGANVTLAGTANNVGTVTGGTYSSTISSSASFPAGHIIQKAYNSYNSGNSTTSTSATFAKVGANWSGQITGVAASSHVLCIMWCNVTMSRGSADLGCGIGFFRDSTGILIPAITNNYFNRATSELTNFRFQWTGWALDTSPPTGTVGYHLGYSSYSSTSVTINSAAADSPFQVLMLEIAQ